MWSREPVPPGACAGPGGYGEFLEALGDPEHERHREGSRGRCPAAYRGGTLDRGHLRPPDPEALSGAALRLSRAPVAVS